MKAWNSKNLVFEISEFIEFLFEIFKLRICCVELFEFLLLVSLPEPVESAESYKESSNTILGSLNRTNKEKNDLDDFFVLSDPIIEWLSELLRLILLVPVLNILGGLENMACSSVDSTLHLLKG